MFSQSAYPIRFEWGPEGVGRLAPLSGVVVIVDVLSFCTSVDIAVSKDAVVFPYRYHDQSASAFAQSIHALLADKRGQGFSLSPSSLLSLPSQSRIVLPSPNGSTCTVLAQENGALVIAGCLRNASQVAAFIKRHYAHETISVIACGEQWPNGRLRPALEDFLGAGAILSQLDPWALSVEAQVAAWAFQNAQANLSNIIMQSSSGRELTVKGFTADVLIASECNVSTVIPVLKDGAYVRSSL
ncbi:2-phosphosulfolactate phosphatase [Sulfobacillus thermosulfidooxidans]|uniref:2-phosphosulfolactate phosphatase n=1 Tax=Sulfobacillus thermosulfidooxidans TaxID=28034 RepID=UPI00031A25B1|nr:2-phosphosulfolactate phosphatase [Sulfobacillus thermosulfidooxidans]